MYKYRIEAHVPVNNNERIPYDKEVFRELEILILSTATGFTRRGEEKVWYSSDGMLNDDIQIIYTIDISDPTVGDILRQSILDYILETMNQEEAYVLYYELSSVWKQATVIMDTREPYMKLPKYTDNQYLPPLSEDDLIIMNRYYQERDLDTSVPRYEVIK